MKRLSPFTRTHEPLDRAANWLPVGIAAAVGVLLTVLYFATNAGGALW